MKAAVFYGKEDLRIEEVDIPEVNANEEVKIKPFELFKKEIILKTSYINPYTQKRALDLIESKQIDVASLIYKTISLDELPALLRNKECRRFGKYIVKP